MNIDKFRKTHLALAELIDSWRIIPRIILAGYGFLLYKASMWYMSLEPHVMDNCTAEHVKDCIVNAPTTQHSVLLTALIGGAGAIFGFYSKSGREWTKGIGSWMKDRREKADDDSSA